MFHYLKEFLEYWKNHSQDTIKVLGNLTDASLGQRVGPEDRTIARVAWHCVTSIPEMAERMGLKLSGPAHTDPVPKTAKAIQDGYAQLAKSLGEQLEKNWTDATLEIEDDMYGMRWKRGLTLLILIQHEIHHRGQLTVLMRQAGLKVPGVYGPAREEWVKYGAPAPEI
jgi:uncharacterized damage-inducible protein DinB